MTQFEETPRKVHFFYDWEGRLIPGTNRKFANTACRMNSDVPVTHITEKASEVTCRLCKRKMKQSRFKPVHMLAPAVVSAQRIQRLERTLAFALDAMGDVKHSVAHSPTGLTVEEVILAALRE